MKFKYARKEVDFMHSPLNMNESELKEFWEDWLSKYDEKSLESEDLFYEKSVYELVKVAIENKQYCSDSEFKEVKRIIKFRINLPRSAMKQVLGIDTFSIYGLGLFTLVDGIFMSSSSRDKSGYDTKGRHSYFDLSFVPDSIKSSYEFSLAIPAFNGLFVPKKSSLTRWMTSVKQLQYFDLSI